MINPDIVAEKPRLILLLFILFSSFQFPIWTNAQTCLTGGIQFFTQSEIDAFPDKYPGCKQILGDVAIIQGSFINNLEGLRAITSIRGNLRVIENRSLSNLHGLTALTSVGGNLTIAGNHSLVNLEGLESITSVGGNLSIDDNASLIDVDALGKLDLVGGRFGIYNCEVLNNLDGFNKIKSIGGYLDIHNNDALKVLDGFGALEKAGGIWIINNDNLLSVGGLNKLTFAADNIDVRNNPTLEKITGFQNVITVGNSLVLENDDHLTDLSGFRSLQSVGKSIVVVDQKKLPDLSGLNHIAAAGGLEIRDNTALASLSGLNGLISLNGLLQLNNNPSLADLSALNGIVSIKGALQIVNNPSLTTLEGLGNIDYSTIESLTLTGCSALSSCSVSSICDYLNFGRNAAISANAAGCNGKQEVISANSACAPNFVSQARSLWKTNQGRWLLFLSLFAVLAAIGSWFFYHHRQRYRLLQLRTTLAQDLHDDLGSEMSGIALASYAAAHSGDPEQMSAALETIAGRSQKLVDDMRDIVWSIHPDNDTLEKMVNRMRQYASKLLDEQDAALHFDISPSALPVKMEPEARKQLYLLFKEAVNNLARYSRCTEVEVGIRREPGQFILEIRDNGVGFDAKTATAGNGLRNMRNRAAVLNGSLDIDSRAGQGTVVRLRAPLS